MARRDYEFAPSIRRSRTFFGLDHDVKTSMNVGTLYPIGEPIEVVPGDTFSFVTPFVNRGSSAFIKPIMDNLYMEVAHFFVPYRLVYDDAERIFGNPTPSAYIDNDLAEVPLNSQAFEVKHGSVGDYLGITPSVYPIGSLNLMPFRAFALIWDTWYRNQNVDDELYIQKGDGSVAGEVPTPALDGTFKPLSAWSPNNYCDGLPKVRKKLDYFTSCLPAPQKGADVTFPLINERVPVTYGSSETNQFNLKSSTSGSNVYANVVGGSGNSPIDYPAGLVDSAGRSMTLGVDLAQVNAISVNDLNLALKTQQMLMLDASFGSRYNEYLLSHWGVYSPDLRLQLPEFLGGSRTPLNIQQVAQTSASSEESPLAALGGYSFSNGRSRFSKGFTEHGYIVTVGLIRQYHTYQQGVPKSFLRRNRYDIYDPMFANIGPQPVYESELFYKNPVSDIDYTKDLRETVFGWQEAFADYKSRPNRITGQMRSKVDGVSPDTYNSLDKWHLADLYENAPVLTSAFINETPDFLDRVLTVESEVQDQFIIDFFFRGHAIRVMPYYSQLKLTTGF